MRNGRSYSVRAVTAADRDHLFRVYVSTREEELSIVPWTPFEKNAFLKMQFSARERSYGERFRAEDQHVVEKDGKPIGYVWTHRADGELQVVDVALLPEHRNGGIGTEIMTAIIDEARDENLPVRLYVLTTSAARRLYERLGFRSVGEQGMNQVMELLP